MKNKLIAQETLVFIRQHEQILRHPERQEIRNTHGWNHKVCLEGEIKYLAEVLK